MACDLSFLVLKAVAAFQDPQHVAHCQSVCKNWCWGMREQTASITSSSICSGGSKCLQEGLLSGACAPESLVLDIVGRHDDEVAGQEKESLATFLAGLKQHVWFKKLAVVQERVNVGTCSAGYTRKAGYSANWQLEMAAPLVDTSLMLLPPKLQVLDLRLECLPGPSVLSSISICPSLKSFTLDCQQGTLTLSDAEQLQGGLGSSLQALSLSLPEMQLSAVEALLSALTSLSSLRLERKTASVCALALRGLAGLKKLEELRLDGYGVGSMAVLKALTGLTALELSHAGLESQDDWQVLFALTVLKELHLVPAPAAMVVQRQVNCESPLLLPQLTSLKMLVNDHPAALIPLTGTPVLHTLHLALPHAKDLSSNTLERLSSLSTLSSLTLTGSHLTMTTSMLRVLCRTAQHVTHLAFLGRLGPLEGDSLALLGSSLTKLKHLSLGSRHMDQMFVIDLDAELPASLETLELCSACIIQHSLKLAVPPPAVIKQPAVRGRAAPTGVVQEQGIGLRNGRNSGRGASRQTRGRKQQGRNAALAKSQGHPATQGLSSLTRTPGPDATDPTAAFGASAHAQVFGTANDTAALVASPHTPTHCSTAGHTAARSPSTHTPIWGIVNSTSAPSASIHPPILGDAHHVAVLGESLDPAVAAAAVATVAMRTTTGGAIRWPHMRTLCLHKCCGVPPGSTTPDSTMLQPIILDMHSAPCLSSLSLTDCTLSDTSLRSLLASSTVSSLTLAPYENWRGTAAQLTPNGLEEVLWSSACVSLQKLELRLTHRMHRDGTDAALIGTVLPGMVQLRALRLFTEESHWHRLPAVKALGRLRQLQQLRLGAVHERRVQALLAGLRQVLPQHCRLTVVKYSPELMEE